MSRLTLWCHCFCVPAFALAGWLAILTTVECRSAEATRRPWLTTDCKYRYGERGFRKRTCHALQMKLVDDHIEREFIGHRENVVYRRVIDLAVYPQYRANCSDKCELQPRWCNWGRWSSTVPCGKRTVIYRKREKCCRPSDVSLIRSAREICTMNSEGIENQSKHVDGPPCTENETMEDDRRTISIENYIYMLWLLPAVTIVLSCFIWCRKYKCSKPNVSKGRGHGVSAGDVEVTRTDTDSQQRRARTAVTNHKTQPREEEERERLQGQ